MHPRRLELLLERERLRARIEHQREHLAHAAWPIEAACSVGDGVAAGADWVRRHPWLIGGMIGGLLVARPKKVFAWARRSVVAWRLWSSIRQRLDAVLQRFHDHL